VAGERRIKRRSRNSVVVVEAVQALDDPAAGGIGLLTPLKET